MKGLGNPWEASQGSRICIASAIGSEQIIVLRVPANQTRPERQDNRRIDIGAMDECELGRRGCFDYWVFLQLFSRWR
jgi:hypothetical protein